MEAQQQENQAAEPKKKKSRVKIFAIIGGVVVIGAVLWIMLSGGKETTDNAQIDADIVPIRSSVPGYVKSIYFEDNQNVKKGDTLLQIDDTDLRTRVAQAEAALENARANLASVRGNAKATSQNAEASSLAASSSQQNIAAARARLTRAREDFNRTSNLLKAKAATQSQYDAARAELDIAQAQYDAAVNQSQSSSAQAQGVRTQANSQSALISLAEALVRQREAELLLAQTQLSYATVLAPCDGIVSRRSVEPGQYITIAAPLCSVIDNVHIWITANFKETQVDAIRPGQPVEVEIDAYPEMKLHGKVASYVGATGAKFSLLPPDNSTGNFVKIVQRVPVRIDLNSVPAKDRSMLFPGLSAFVTVKTK
jgi:membrane fusion protein, multidrug efflux system